MLTFVEDHGLMQNCDAAGTGDSGLYPGAGADTGAGRDTKYYPEFRYSQEIRRCDSHHNLAATRARTATPPTSTTTTSTTTPWASRPTSSRRPGHPGFPQDSDLVEYNNFYSNNFNVYAADSRHQAPT